MSGENHFLTPKPCSYSNLRRRVTCELHVTKSQSNMSQSHKVTCHNVKMSHCYNVTTLHVTKSHLTKSNIFSKTKVTCVWSRNCQVWWVWWRKLASVRIPFRAAAAGDVWWKCRRHIFCLAPEAKVFHCILLKKMYTISFFLLRIYNLFLWCTNLSALDFTCVFSARYRHQQIISIVSKC